MTENTHATVLRRMARAQVDDVAANPLTSSRAVRLALIKAANDTVDLTLTVSSVAEDISALDSMLDALPESLMLVGLHRQGALVGLMAVDMQLRAAVLEMQTMGVLVAQKAEDRAPTRTDKSLCDPLLTSFLAAFPAAVQGTAFDGWGNDVDVGDTIKTTRAAGLLLADVPYRLVQMTVDLGVADRQGQLLMALPLVPDPVAEVPVDATPVDWHDAFQVNVGAAPSVMTAILHRFDMPLATAQNLHVGMIVPLLGCSVGSVKLMAADGKVAATAKLGQSGGMRAVRLQPPPSPDMHDLTTASVPDMPAMTADPNPMLEVDTALPDMASIGGFDVPLDEESAETVPMMDLP